ncbi:zinc finger domain-containing protein [Streptomyces rapamycinicus]|uniref:zinc finger domain-containing protein n=1 Tax=Streptomyces rapamycinicus TaxID=1226757 RepID=UPI003CCD2C4C
MHKQVARRHWIKRNCPRCHAGKGADCAIGDGTGTGEVRAVPHDERLLPIVEERKNKAQQTPRPWRVYEVTCPDRGKAPGARCASPSGGVHRSRVDLARENTRKGLPRS